MWPCHSWVYSTWLIEILIKWPLFHWNDCEYKYEWLFHFSWHFIYLYTLCISPNFVKKLQTRFLLGGSQYIIYWRLMHKVCMISANSHWCSTRSTWSRRSIWSIWSKGCTRFTRCTWFPWSLRSIGRSWCSRSTWFPWATWSTWHVKVWLLEWLSGVIYNFVKKYTPYIL